MKLSVGTPPSLVKGLFAEPNLEMRPEGEPLALLPAFGPRIQTVPERMGPGAWGPSLRLGVCVCDPAGDCPLHTSPFSLSGDPLTEWCGGRARRRAGPSKRPTAVSLPGLWEPHQGDGVPGGGCLSVENSERTGRHPKSMEGFPSSPGTDLNHATDKGSSLRKSKF